jgi:hypothetical protein
MKSNWLVVGHMLMWLSILRSYRHETPTFWSLKEHLPGMP